jgi:serine/threonine protein phosphatase 1
MRTIIIGDVHGCFDELEALLAKVHASESDRVVLAGDVTRKGPAADRCIELSLRSNVRVILGNRDAALLKRARWPIPWWAARAPDRPVLRRPELIAEMTRWPLFLDFPDIGVVTIHGGLLPNSERFTPELVSRDAALDLRYIRRGDDGRWTMVPKGKQARDDPFWSEMWNGDRTVVYGHTPRMEPKVDARAIGIDTGCVYGGSLTAAVFDARGHWQLESVTARRRYAGR